jgi:hypothetical protein
MKLRNVAVDSPTATARRARRHTLAESSILNKTLRKTTIEKQKKSTNTSATPSNKPRKSKSNGATPEKNPSKRKAKQKPSKPPATAAVVPRPQWAPIDRLLGTF